MGQGWAADPTLEIAEGMRLLQLVLSIDENDADFLSIVGRVKAYLLGDFDEPIDMVDRATRSTRNSALAWEQRGWTYAYGGRSEEAIRSFEHAIRLSPFDPLLFSTFTGMGLAYVGLGRFDKAVEAASKALRKNQNFSSTYRCLASALAHSGAQTRRKARREGSFEMDPGSQTLGIPEAWRQLAFRRVHRGAAQGRASGVTLGSG